MATSLLGPQAVASTSNRSMAGMTASVTALPRAGPQPCSVFFQPRSRTALRPSAARPLCGAWPAAAPQQKAAFRHSAVCAATATADAPAETFQYQAEVSTSRHPCLFQHAVVALRGRGTCSRAEPDSGRYSAAQLQPRRAGRRRTCCLVLVCNFASSTEPVTYGPSAISQLPRGRRRSALCSGYSWRLRSGSARAWRACPVVSISACVMFPGARVPCLRRWTA